MSVVQNPLIGRARQKLGGTVFTTWKGLNVIKGRPLTVANPRTDAQLMRRSALSQMVAIGRTISAAIALGFKEQAVFKSAFNAFTGYNLRNSFDYSAPPAATLVPANILVAQGTISPTPLTTLAADASANTVHVEYDASAGSPGQSAADLAKCAVYNETTDTWLVPTNLGNNRGDGENDYTCPAGFLTTGDTVRIYHFFYNATNRKSSDSVTSTTVVVA